MDKAPQLRFLGALALTAWILAAGAAPAGETAPADEAAAAPAGAGGGELAAAPSAGRPIRVAIYEGPGATKRSVRNIERSIGLIPGAAAVRVTAEQMRSGGLAEFDVVVFPGGSASAQAKALDRRGRDEVQKYVAGGGGYLGVCAGAYLACAGFDWGLQLVNARTLSDRWQRGEGAVEIALTDEGRQMFGPCRRALAVHYENGPVFGPLDRDDLPAYRVLATYATEVAENNTPAGIMVGAPALAESSYGEGRVIISSPHPEASPGLESIVPLALVRLAAKEASERNGSPAKER